MQRGGYQKMCAVIGPWEILIHTNYSVSHHIILIHYSGNKEQDFAVHKIIIYMCWQRSRDNKPEEVNNSKKE